jgi:hypothetical protein
MGLMSSGMTWALAIPVVMAVVYGVALIHGAVTKNRRPETDAEYEQELGKEFP